MISKLLFFVLVVPLAIVLIVFSVANRQPVTVSFDPLGTFPQLAFDAPLFVLLMGSVIIGVVLGGIGTWMTQAHYRRKSSRRKHEIDRLRREAAEAQSKVTRLEGERAAPRLENRTGGSTELVTRQAA